MKDCEQAAYERLRAEGLWPEANQFRESERKRLRAEGRKPAVACDESWANMLVRFPVAVQAGGDSPSPVTGPSLLSLMPQQLRRGVDSTKRASVREAAQWAFNNSRVELDSIDPGEVPSRGALGLLVWVQATPANYSHFISTIWAKLLPSKSQLDAESRLADDGRAILAMLDEFEASRAAEAAARAELH